MIKTILFLIISLFFFSSFSRAADLPAGSIKTVKGNVVIIRQNQILPAAIGEKIFKNDGLRTGPGGTLGIIFKDDSLLSLGPNTEVTISEFLFSPAEGKLSMVARIIKGTVAYLSGIIARLSPDSVRLETPVGNVGIRGTKFAIKIEGEGPSS
ncbi:MAG: FecR domain-containing protein [Deltaproteobacteria bacterium]|nr:FecR domain-containing protein [Deltaproteobacteria bacterium]